VLSFPEKKSVAIAIQSFSTLLYITVVAINLALGYRLCTRSVILVLRQDHTKFDFFYNYTTSRVQLVAL